MYEFTTVKPLNTPQLHLKSPTSLSIQVNSHHLYRCIIQNFCDKRPTTDFFSPHHEEVNHTVYKHFMYRSPIMKHHVMKTMKISKYRFLYQILWVDSSILFRKVFSKAHFKSTCLAFLGCLHSQQNGSNYL